MSRLTSTISVAAVLIFFAAGETFAKNTPWSDRIDLKGDFRDRIEAFTGRNGTLNRVRVRLELISKVHDDVTAGIGLASGGDSPVSTNQTLSDGFSTKDIRLDLAYFTWKPSSARGVFVSGGKMKLPFYTPGQSQLIWDGDLRPEGLVAGLHTRPSSLSASLVVGAFIVESTGQLRDVSLSAVHADVKMGARDATSYGRVGGGYFDYNKLKGHSIIYDDNSHGNSFNYGYYDPVSNSYPLMSYVYDYTLLEAFIELGTKMGSNPVTVFGDYVTNSELDSNNVGWLLGIRIGKTKRAGSWDLLYSYRKVERDAVLGVFTDSDFGGGQTGVQGHTFGMNVLLAERIKATCTVYVNDRYLDQVNDFDYHRGQLDIAFKF